MTLPEKDHPVWLVLRGLIALAALALLLTHQHAGMFDRDDLSGPVAVVSGGDLVRVLLKRA